MEPLNVTFTLKYLSGSAPYIFFKDTEKSAENKIKQSQWVLKQMTQGRNGTYSITIQLKTRDIEYRYGIESPFSPNIKWQSGETKKLSFPEIVTSVEISDEWGNTLKPKTQNCSDFKEKLLLKRKIAQSQYFSLIPNPSLSLWEEKESKAKKPMKDIVSSLAEISSTSSESVDPKQSVVSWALRNDNSERESFLPLLQVSSISVPPQWQRQGRSTLVKRLFTASSPAAGQPQKKEQQGQKVICAGYLTKLGQKMPTWKRRYFELLPSMLIYYASQGDYDKPRGYFENKRISCIQVISIAGKDVPAFQIVTEGRVCRIYADSAQDFEKWMNAFKGLKIKVASK